MASLRRYEAPSEPPYAPVPAEGAARPLAGSHRLPSDCLAWAEFATPTSYTEAVQPAPGIVDPNWAPPSGPPVLADPKPIPASLLYGSILLAVVLLIVAIWAFGGFDRRTDLLKTTAPGTVITTGPYEFRFTEATAQRKKGFDGSFYWELVMIGEGRTTGKESISPSYIGNSSMFVSKDAASNEVTLPDSVRMGHNRGFDRHRFTPGLPLSPYAVVFKYKDTYRPGPTIRFAVSELEYGKHYLASEEEGWHNGTYGFQFYLPVRVLPPEQP
jgi:hypothetical protein